MKVSDRYKLTKYVEQACGDCIIRVEAWKPNDGEHGFVDVQVISNSSTAWNMRIVRRIKNAWKVLRGSYDWSGFEMLSREEAEALLEALETTTREAFPKVVTQTTIKRT